MLTNSFIEAFFSYKKRRIFDTDCDEYDPIINVGEIDCGNPANDAANPASVTTKVFSVEKSTYGFLVSYVQPLMSKINSKL